MLSSRKLAGSGVDGIVGVDGTHGPEGPPAVPSQNASPGVVPGFPIQVSSEWRTAADTWLKVSNSASPTCDRIISHWVICPAPFVENSRKNAWSNAPVVFRLVSVLRPSVKLNDVGVMVAFVKFAASGFDTVNDPERSHWTGHAATPVKVVKSGPVDV